MGTLNVNVVDQIDQIDHEWLMDVDETSEMRVCASSANFTCKLSPSLLSD
jgi:hypothetical protein